MKNGKLIVICGIDGSGKTTLQKSIAQELEAKGKKVITTRQPSDFYRTNPDVRGYLDSGKNSLSINTIAMIAATDRMIHIEKVITPHLKNGTYVICDRYVYSTFAYFQARSANMDFIKALNQYVPPPDAGIFLGIQSQLAVNRVIARDGDNRKFEEKDAEYLEKVQGYLKETLPDSFKIVNAALTAEQVLNNSLHHLENINVY